MSDLTLQQSHARPTSGEELEVLGKQASADWSCGKYNTLTEAVTETVKQAHLAPEQVKRVIEFANTDAFLREFKKEGMHKVVEFPGGPADPSEILKDLNDGGGGSVFDRGTRDYNDAPSLSKAAASTQEETELQQLFGSTGEVQYPYANPHQEVVELRDKLAGVYQQLNSEIDSLEVDFADSVDRMYREIKQACLSGTSLGEVVQAWSEIHPTQEQVKLAFQALAPRLCREGVFHTPEQMSSSFAKTAGAVLVNVEHPVVATFYDYCSTLQKLAESRATSQEVRENLGQLTAFLKQAGVGGGLVGKVTRGAENVAPTVGKGVRKAVTALAGEGAGEVAGKGAALATKYAPHAAGAIAAKNVYDEANQSPTYHRFLRYVPGTQDYRARMMGY